MPVTGLAMQVHHRDDPDPIGFFEVNDSIRKALREIPPRLRCKRKSCIIAKESIVSEEFSHEAY